MMRLIPFRLVFIISIGLALPSAAVCAGIRAEPASFTPSAEAPSAESALADSCVMPARFRGGDLFAFKRWVLERLKLPAGAPAHVRGGITSVRFTVTSAGKVRNVGVKDVMGTTFDRQIRRLVASSTGWTAGTRDGLPTDTECEMNLKFRLQPSSGGSALPAEDIEVYETVDTEPAFDAGGTAELSQRLHDRVVDFRPLFDTLPARVTVRLVVEKDGSFDVSEVTAVMDGNPKELKNAVLEALKELPPAAPARIQDVVVRSSFSFDVIFGDPDIVASKFGDGAYPLESAETMPAFQGGDLMKFRSWVQANLKYPAALAAEDVQGRVLVCFVIERDGTLTNIRILQSPDKRLSELVVSVLETSPRWTPGEQYGETVRVRYTLPLDFRLREAPAYRSERSERSSRHDGFSIPTAFRSVP